MVVASVHIYVKPEWHVLPGLNLARLLSEPGGKAQHQRSKPMNYLLLEVFLTIKK